MKAVTFHKISILKPLISTISLATISLWKSSLFKVTFIGWATTHSSKQLASYYLESQCKNFKENNISNSKNDHCYHMYKVHNFTTSLAPIADNVLLGISLHIACPTDKKVIHKFTEILSNPIFIGLAIIPRYVGWYTHNEYIKSAIPYTDNLAVNSIILKILMTSTNNQLINSCLENPIKALPIYVIIHYCLPGATNYIKYFNHDNFLEANKSLDFFLTYMLPSYELTILYPIVKQIKFSEKIGSIASISFAIPRVTLLLAGTSNFYDIDLKNIVQITDNISVFFIPKIIYCFANFCPTKNLKNICNVFGKDATTYLLYQLNNIIKAIDYAIIEEIDSIFGTEWIQASATPKAQKTLIKESSIMACKSFIQRPNELSKLFCNFLGEVALDSVNVLCAGYHSNFFQLMPHRFVKSVIKTKFQNYEAIAAKDEFLGNPLGYFAVSPWRTPITKVFNLNNTAVKNTTQKFLYNDDNLKCFFKLSHNVQQGVCHEKNQFSDYTTTPISLEDTPSFKEDSTQQNHKKTFTFPQNHLICTFIELSQNKLQGVCYNDNDTNKQSLIVSDQEKFDAIEELSTLSGTVICHIMNY